ncbi:MFS transporter [Pusillimonas sp. SM2304]|uniref:MFS transporter n=1 Tax=Pusillimonas sp. SM2304 TaxID=3073241 RepID=UPI002876485B|nr:MFS transporter [Pusillimonas sp. SM2304]MDS1139909.1 MFS transporter [Pusillimonas sp. SM2304]
MMHTLRALGYPDYRIFLAGQGAALIGIWCQRIALVWLVYSTTGSPLLLGLVAFAGEIPFLILSPMGGVIADRLDQRKALIIIETIAAIQAFILAALVWTGTASMPLILFLTMILGTCQALDMPLRQTMFPKMISNPQDMPNAVALMAFMNNAGRLIGPIIAGFLISAFGEQLCFVLSGTGYLLVIAALYKISIPPGNMTDSGETIAQQLHSGAVYAWSNLPIRATLGLLGMIGFCYLPYLILAPVFVQDVLLEDARTLGYLLSSAGIGALLGLGWIARQTEVKTFPRAICLSSAVGAIGMLMFAQSASLLPATIAITMVGIGIVVSATAINIYLQIIVQPAKRGRVLGLYTTAFFGIAPLGNFFAGAIMESIGVTATMRTLGLAGLLCTIAFAVTYNRINKASARLTAQPDAEQIN